MLQGEHSAIHSTIIKLQFVIKIFVLSIFRWPFYIGFIVNKKFCILSIFALPPLNTHAEASIRARGLNFSPSLHLHQYFEYASNGFDEYVHLCRLG